MGRGSRSSGRSSAGTSFGRTSTATASKRSAPNNSAFSRSPSSSSSNYTQKTQSMTAQQNSTRTAPSPQQQHAVPASSGGPGLLGMGLSSMAGSMAGNYLFDSFFAKGDNNKAHEIEDIQDPSKYGVCSDSFSQFLTCSSANSNDISTCQWIYHQFTDCLQKNNQALPPSQ